MSLKSAALFAFCTTLILTVFRTLDFINTITADMRGLIPAARLLTSFVDLLACVGVTVFFFVFQRQQR